MRFALLACVLGCASGGPKSAASVANACWPVVPLRLEALEHKTEWEPLVVLEADGSVQHLKTKKTFAKVTPDRVHFPGDDLICNANRSITTTGGPSDMHYDGSDALVESDIRIFVRDDGEVEMTSHGKAIFGPTGSGRARVVGDIATARRTAEVLVLLALAGPTK
jgi:hypothetical protein